MISIVERSGRFSIVFRAKGKQRWITVGSRSEAEIARINLEHSSDLDRTARILYGPPKFERKKKNESKLIGNCEICGGESMLCRDHDHATGLSRGTLCVCCNAGLGMFKDNIMLMTNAIEYLKSSVVE